MLKDEIMTWKKKYPFLEGLINECSNLFGIIEEPKIRNRNLDQCMTHGYDCTQGESTSWQWYGVRDNTVKELEKEYYYLKDVMSKENFDYLITLEHIRTDMFEDDTIRIYKLT
jgi:hypothetical protein